MFNMRGFFTTYPWRFCEPLPWWWPFEDTRRPLYIATLSTEIGFICIFYQALKLLRRLMPNRQQRQTLISLIYLIGSTITCYLVSLGVPAMNVLHTIIFIYIKNYEQIENRFYAFHTANCTRENTNPTRTINTIETNQNNSSTSSCGTMNRGHIRSQRASTRSLNEAVTEINIKTNDCIKQIRAEWDDIETESYDEYEEASAYNSSSNVTTSNSTSNFMRNNNNQGSTCIENMNSNNRNGHNSHDYEKSATEDDSETTIESTMTASTIAKTVSHYSDCSKAITSYDTEECHTNTFIVEEDSSKKSLCLCNFDKLPDIPTVPNGLSGDISILNAMLTAFCFSSHFRSELLIITRQLKPSSPSRLLICSLENIFELMTNADGDSSPYVTKQLNQHMAVFVAHFQSIEKEIANISILQPENLPTIESMTERVIKVLNHAINIGIPDQKFKEKLSRALSDGHSLRVREELRELRTNNNDECAELESLKYIGALIEQSEKYYQSADVTYTENDIDRYVLLKRVHARLLHHSHSLEPIFQMNELHEGYCCDCGYKRITCTEQRIVSVIPPPDGESLSIRDLLFDSTSIKRRCRQCGGERFNIDIEFATFSPCIIFAFHRTMPNTYGGKILAARDFVIPPSYEKYRLKSMIVEHAKPFGSRKHVVAYAETNHAQHWYKFNDDIVTRVANIDQIIEQESSNCVLLLYEKRSK